MHRVQGTPEPKVLNDRALNNPLDAKSSSSDGRQAEIGVGNLRQDSSLFAMNVCLKARDPYAGSLDADRTSGSVKPDPLPNQKRVFCHPTEKQSYCPAALSA